MRRDRGPGRGRGRAPGRIPGTRAVCALLAAVQLATASTGAPDLRGQPSATLDAAERAADRGELAEARQRLAAWFASEEAASRGADVERARFLRARLSNDLDSARVDYLWVAIRGDDRYGAAARLRLAQMYVAEGRLDRAREDLDRLRTDFPGSPLVLTAWLWTGNVLAAAGDPEGACAAWERAAATPVSEATRADRDLAAQALATCRSRDSQAPLFTVQLGAFRSREAAVELRDRVAAAGSTVRLVEPQDPDGLYRVRSGRFVSREEAARHAVRLTDEGLAAIVVPEEQ